MTAEAQTIASVGVEAAALLAALRAEASATLPWRPEDFTALLRQPTVQALVLSEDERGAPQPRGYAMFAVVAGEAEIYDIAVVPTKRRGGRGRALLEALVARAVAAGAAAVHLEVDVDNEAARRLYDRCGFVLAGRRRGYYRHRDGRVSDALVMRLDLQDD